MPATFPAHPAAVLPLKLWRPAWFDGVALVVGSMAPDLAYALDGSRLERPFPGLPPLWELAHSLPWFLAWAVPVTIALCPLIRLSAPTLASHLPAPPRTPPGAPDARAFHAPAPPPATLGAPATRLATALRRLATALRRLATALRRLASDAVAPLRGYAFLGRGPRWYITVSSAGIGALSHVLWDRIAVGPLDLASSLLGGLFGLWLLLRFGRRLSPTTPPERRPQRFNRPSAPPAPGTSGSAAVSDTSAASLAAQPAPGSPSGVAGVASLSAASGACAASGLSAASLAGLPGRGSPGVAASGAETQGSGASEAGGVSGAGGVSEAGGVSGVGGPRRAAFWGTAAAVVVVGGAFLPFLPGYFLPHTTSARVILLAIAAVLIAAAVARLRPVGRESFQQ